MFREDVKVKMISPQNKIELISLTPFFRKINKITTGWNEDPEISAVSCLNALFYSLKTQTQICLLDQTNVKIPS